MPDCFSGIATMLACVGGFERIIGGKRQNELELARQTSIDDLPSSFGRQMTTRTRRREEYWEDFYDNILVPVAKSGRCHYAPFGFTDVTTRDHFLQEHFGGMSCDEIKALASAHSVSVFSETVGDHSRATLLAYKFLQSFGMGCEEVMILANSLNVPFFKKASYDNSKGHCCIEFSW